MRQLSARLLLCALAACGGGSSEVSLTIDDAPRLAGRSSVILTGKSFVPDGSSCPASAEFVRIGTLGARQISLVAGDNPITITMVAGTRRSAATVTLRPV